VLRMRRMSNEIPAIKTSIFGQLNWSIRRPSHKQSKQLAREKRQAAQRARSTLPDERKEKEEQIVKHTGWSFFRRRD
jgi:large subunit ribosomal protein L32